VKIAALDIGDQWTGIALSDTLGLLAKPYKTVATIDLRSAIKELFEKEQIMQCIVGHPKTLKGTASEQTKKIEAMVEALEQVYPAISWCLWDERLSSKRASMQKKDISKEEKLRSHSIAAAFILDSYLTYKSRQQELIL
jgi:putative Holliday junction resolvase